MGALVAGFLLLAFVLGLFHLKERTYRLWIARFAYSRFVARLAVLAAALIIVGTLLVLDSAFDRLFA